MTRHYPEGAGDRNHPHEATYSTEPQRLPADLRERAQHEAARGDIGGANRLNQQAAHRERTDPAPSNTNPHTTGDQYRGKDY
jgi:hypothetical protein